MKRSIVVFERDERHTETGKPEIDFRLERQSLPGGSTPLAIVTGNGFSVIEGEWFNAEEVSRYAEIQSGYSI